MPRPDDITDAQITEWEEKFQQLLAKEEGEPLPLKKSVKSLEAGREVYYAGQWLYLKLEKHVDDMTEADRQDLTTAYGQIAFGREPWGVARIVLRDAIIGRTYRPGSALADALLMGHLDQIFGQGPDFTGVEGLRRYLAATGFSSLQEMVEHSGAANAGELKKLLEGKLATMEANIRHTP